MPPCSIFNVISDPAEVKPVIREVNRHFSQPPQESNSSKNPECDPNRSPLMVQHIPRLLYESHETAATIIYLFICLFIWHRVVALV